jgi:transposase-like protein
VPRMLAMSVHVIFDRSAHLSRVCALVRDGMRLSQVAAALGVPEASLRVWLACHEDFAAALREADAEYQDAQVVEETAKKQGG